MCLYFKNKNIMKIEINFENVQIVIIIRFKIFLVFKNKFLIYYWRNKNLKFE